MAATVPVKAEAEPIERSTCAATRSMVPGTARIPATETAERMLIQLSTPRKYGEAKEKYTKSPPRNSINAANSGTDRPGFFTTAGALSPISLIVTSDTFPYSLAA